MKSGFTTLLICALAGSLIGAFAGERGKAPQAVEDAVKTLYPNATISGAERERISVTVYEVKVQNGEERLELTVASDGTVIASERQIKADALPSAARQALEKAAKGEAFSEVTQEEQRAKLGWQTVASPVAVYEAEWKGGEATVAADGALLAEDDDDDDDDDDE